MKKLRLFILVMFAVTGLSGYAAAQSSSSSSNLDPGCDPEMMTILTDQANAVRARDKAYEMEIISREPS
ncbi:MAG: hypothetical protein KGQ70_08625, partial [Alphaproteobacteria bacterium]|nr:hypothetical protein [Alphaproteobacteria bacterium]